MNAKVFILLGLAAVAAAGSSEEYAYRRPRDSSEESVEYVYRPPPHASSEESVESSEAQYAFNWAVKHYPSRNDYGHQETRDGDDTQGSYYVQLPDGRLQKVTYYVDGDSGYVADVSYEGEAQHPESYESHESESNESFEAPRYAPPRPRYSVPDSNESNESFEAPRYAPPRARYFVPDSNESK
ncbi:hypothetical protein SK128_016687 [Halocaridina rubra]|uniref:Pro-resilin n=1 Tax=Halocaridina rubra TaxID=373956 RepID=A0AAN8X269_HALRR